MREIKFRAWVKYTTDNRWEWAYKKAKETMSKSQDLDDDATRLRSEYCQEWDNNHKPEEQYYIKEYMTNFDEVSISLSGKLVKLINLEVLDIMQFTGLKDKNGLKEIYEGDIISPEGNLKGNIYESPQVYEKGIDCLIEGLGTKAWRNTESIAMGFGCNYAE